MEGKIKDFVNHGKVANTYRGFFSYSVDTYVNFFLTYLDILGIFNN